MKEIYINGGMLNALGLGLISWPCSQRTLSVFLDGSLAESVAISLKVYGYIPTTRVLPEMNKNIEHLDLLVVMNLKRKWIVWSFRAQWLVNICYQMCKWHCNCTSKLLSSHDACSQKLYHCIFLKLMFEIIFHCVNFFELINIYCASKCVFRWFKFTLKPPYRIAIGNFFSAIWDTSHWNFLVKFGLKTAWDMSYDILLSLLKFVNFWQLQGHLSILAKIGCLQKIKVFLMKERQGFDATWGGFR